MLSMRFIVEFRARDCEENDMPETAALLRRLWDRCEWKPIETAPKDRLILLCMVPHRGYLTAPTKVGGWREDQNRWEIFGGSWSPTHWMELPEPPEVKK